MNSDLARKAYEAYCLMLPGPPGGFLRWEQLSQNERIAWGKAVEVGYNQGRSDGYSEGHQHGHANGWRAGYDYARGAEYQD